MLKKRNIIQISLKILSRVEFSEEDLLQIYDIFKNCLENDKINLDLRSIAQNMLENPDLKDIIVFLSKRMRFRDFRALYDKFQKDEILTNFAGDLIWEKAKFLKTSDFKN